MPILKENKLEYSYFWLQMVLGSLCHTVAHPACDMSMTQKVKMISDLKESSFFYDWIMDVNLRDLIKLSSLRYGVLLWLYKCGFYKSCIRLYQIQYKKHMK